MCLGVPRVLVQLLVAPVDFLIIIIMTFCNFCFELCFCDIVACLIHCTIASYIHHLCVYNFVFFIHCYIYRFASRKFVVYNPSLVWFLVICEFFVYDSENYPFLQQMRSLNLLCRWSYDVSAFCLICASVITQFKIFVIVLVKVFIVYFCLSINVRLCVCVWKHD